MGPCSSSQLAAHRGVTQPPGPGDPALFVLLGLCTRGPSDPPSGDVQRSPSAAMSFSHGGCPWPPSGTKGFLTRHCHTPQSFLLTVVIFEASFFYSITVIPDFPPWRSSAHQPRLPQSIPTLLSVGHSNVFFAWSLPLLSTITPAPSPWSLAVCSCAHACVLPCSSGSS